MRTRDEVKAEMMDVVADCRAAAAENDWVSYDLDHHKLSDLITELEHIPLQRKPKP